MQGSCRHVLCQDAGMYYAMTYVCLHGTGLAKGTLARSLTGTVVARVGECRCGGVSPPTGRWSGAPKGAQPAGKNPASIKPLEAS